MYRTLLAVSCILAGRATAPPSPPPLPWLQIVDGRLTTVPRGFNRDRGETGRLMEDCLDAQGAKVEEDVRHLKSLGVPVERDQVQRATLMGTADAAEAGSFHRLRRSLALYGGVALSLDPAGLGGQPWRTSRRGTTRSRRRDEGKAPGTVLGSCL